MGGGWQELSCSTAAARCSSFLDRNGGQVRLYVPTTQEEESAEDIKREGWRGGRRNHDFN